jgi:hypothetical protein
VIIFPLSHRQKHFVSCIQRVTYRWAFVSPFRELEFDPSNLRIANAPE